MKWIDDTLEIESLGVFARINSNETGWVIHFSDTCSLFSTVKFNTVEEAKKDCERTLTEHFKSIKKNIDSFLDNKNIELLEAMRRAAQLGCEDFRIVNGDVEFILNALPTTVVLPSNAIFNGTRYNRYAANVCECWWRKQEIDHHSQRNDVLQMIEICHKFANVYGK